MTDRRTRLVVKAGSSTQSKIRARRQLEALIASGWKVVSETDRGWFGITRTLYTLEHPANRS